MSRASHTHHVPHIGLPQSEPVVRQISVKPAPNGAAASAMTCAKGYFQINPAADATTITE